MPVSEMARLLRRGSLVAPDVFIYKISIVGMAIAGNLKRDGRSIKLAHLIVRAEVAIGERLIASVRRRGQLQNCVTTIDKPSLSAS